MAEALRENQPQRRPGPIPGYDLIRIIGEPGAFGEVWLARRNTRACVAIKVIYKDRAELAQRELEGLRLYDPRNINDDRLVRLIGSGENEQCTYFIMDLADNAFNNSPEDYEPLTLALYLRRQKRLDAHTALKFAKRLVEGVQRMNAEGLRHNDIKPANILMFDRQPRIADFSLVTPLCEPPPPWGTPGYMRDDGTHQVGDDVRALGRVLYQMISGRPASDFPSLPAELLDRPSRELKSAIRIANWACSQRPTLDALAREIDDALARPPRVAPRTVAVALVALAAVLAAATALWPKPPPDPSPPPPTPPYSVARVQLVPDPNLRPEYVSLQGGRAPTDRDRAWVRLGSVPLAEPGLYRIPLEHPSEFFALDFQVRFIRPWGVLSIGVAGEPDGTSSAEVVMAGQVDGEGLRTTLFLNGPDGRGVGAGSERIEGHPQPGLDYYVRLARVGNEIAAALWPLSRLERTPVVVKLPIPEAATVARFVVIESISDDQHALAEVSRLAYREISKPLRRTHDSTLLPEPPPFEPAWLPIISEAVASPARDENLLDGVFRPAESDAWMSIGNWSWWRSTGEAAEIADEVRRTEGDAAAAKVKQETRCVQFSTKGRGDKADKDIDHGWQLLRFDRARYRNFEARILMHLKSPTDADSMPKHDPFTSQSHEGMLGLAFRLQDGAPPGCAWGPGYVAYVHTHPQHTTLQFRVMRFKGLSISDGFAVYGERASDGWEQHAACDYGCEELFGTDGVLLTLRVVDRGVKLFLRGHYKPVLDVTDDGPAILDAGRIALFTSRLIATFDSLTVDPLP